MKEAADIENEADRIVGSAVRNARSRRSDFLAGKRSFVKFVDRKYIETIRNGEELPLTHMAVHISIDHLISSVTEEIILYDILFRYFRGGYNRGATEVAKEASELSVTLAHKIVDNICIDLFNLREIFRSEEMYELVGLDGDKLIEIIDNAFPNIVSARDAVTHYHDRIFGRYKKEKKKSDPIFYRIDEGGKVYSDKYLQEFIFKFSIEKVDEMLGKLNALVAN